MMRFNKNVTFFSLFTLYDKIDEKFINYHFYQYKLTNFRFHYFFASIKNCLPKNFHRKGNLKNKETKTNGRSFTLTIL